MFQGIAAKGLVHWHLLVPHIDPVPTCSESHDVGWQLPVLALPQQLLPAGLVHAQRGAYACQKLALEPRQGSRDAASGCAVHQLQLPSAVLEAVQPDVALCMTEICKSMQELSAAFRLYCGCLLACNMQE